MDRRDRDRDYYGPYEGYNRSDEHYHAARNLTNEFERDYQRHRGHWEDDRGRYRAEHTYHEGDMGDAYERLRREDRDYSGYAGSQQNDWDRNRGYGGSFSRDRDYQEDFGRDRDYGNRRQGYNTSDRSGAYNRNENRGAGYELDFDSRSGSYYRSSRYPERNYGSGRGIRTEDNWYSSGHRRDELNRYY
ncbi:hypothetical protein [Pontibacter anaerobius]|uniref:SWFGD domain-containing protein n=1 Tax=Pontibacter anaerobius TaxID=2993940 RepID=A0ABT3RH74_9BACT|nr:hypothetical protein [Pontibacter anaerobius]MCX2740910.1 hypothetical protein [Pontibacter anaerobius]